MTVGPNATVRVAIGKERLTYPVGDENMSARRAERVTIIYGQPITAGRTVTPANDARVGDRLRVTRQAAATGAPSVSVLGKALAAASWAEAEYTMSGWALIGGGAL
jgi:hypothetical protein